MPKLEWDPEAADDAAQEFETRVRNLMERGELSALELMKMHKEYFMHAGHKRLGRIYVRIVKEQS